MPKKEPKIRGKSKDVKSNISKPKADKAKLKSKSESAEKKCIFQCILRHFSTPRQHPPWPTECMNCI